MASVAPPDSTAADSNAVPGADAARESREALEQRVREMTAELARLRKELAGEISRREMTQRALEGLSRHDPVTMLPNRGLFDETLEEALQQSESTGKKLAVLALNLDRFKTINDSLGHTVGDLLLREVAQRIDSCLRDGDSAGRLGGDEFFVLVAPIADVDDAERMANTIITAVNEPFMLAGHPCTIGVSAGIALWPEHAQNASDLMANSHRAMSGAKKRGRNTVKIFEVW